MPEDFLTLLLVEDNPGDAILIREKLNDALDGHHTEHVGTLHDALDHLATRRYDAVLLDLSLPDSIGLETVRRTHQYAPDTPIVILTGLDDAMFATAALREGARDYVVKGHADKNALSRAIYAAIEQQQMMFDLDARMAPKDALRFRTLVEQLEAGVVVLDMAERVQYLNPAAESLLGRRLPTLQGVALPLDWRSGLSGRRIQQVGTVWEGKPAICMLLVVAAMQGD